MSLNIPDLREAFASYSLELTAVQSRCCGWTHEASIRSNCIYSLQATISWNFIGVKVHFITDGASLDKKSAVAYDVVIITSCLSII